MANLIQIKRGTEANLPTLNEGEFAFATDSYKVWIGDGTTNHRIDFSDTERTKLSGIEELADVTDFANVSAALAAATAAVDFNGQKITGLGTPTLDSDAATKAYADSVASGLDVKESVRVATTSDITLSGTQTIDGVSVVEGDRVLVKNQTTASENGIYVCSSGTWSRSTDADTDDEVTAGMFTFVEEGTENADKGFVLTTDNPITVGTTNLTFSQFSSAGSGATTFVELTDTPSSYTSMGLYITRVNSGETALEFVDFASTYLDDTAGGTSAETSKAPTSNVMYNHGIATTGVHGAGTNTLLHSGSTIDGGSF